MLRIAKASEFETSRLEAQDLIRLAEGRARVEECRRECVGKGFPSFAKA